MAAQFCVSLLLLLLSGDVELNPGPPKRVPGAPSGPPKQEKTKEEQLDILESRVREYEDKFDKLEKNYDATRKEMVSLKEAVRGLMGIDEKVDRLTTKIDAITGVYDDLHEKMHEIDKTRKNNLLFYGIKPDFLPEIPSQLEQKIHEIFRVQLQITRDIPLNKIARMLTGPEVRGCRPVLVNFPIWKDREEVYAKSKLLRGSNIYVTEDLSRKARENRHELSKYMREIRSKSPTKRCVLRYDKLYIDNTPYVFDEERNAVVRFFPPENQRPLSRNNYSSLGDVNMGLTRSISVPSVNGEQGFHPERGGGSRTSLFGSRRVDYASNESLHLAQQQQQQQQYHQPTLDENSEMEELDEQASEVIASPTDLTIDDLPTQSDVVPTQSDVEPQQPPQPREYSKSSIKTAKKILSAVTKHRKADAAKEEKVDPKPQKSDGKVETLQLKKKEKGKKAPESVPAEVSDAPDAPTAANAEDPPIEAQVENGDVTSLQADQVDPSNDDPPPDETPIEENV